MQSRQFQIPTATGKLSAGDVAFSMTQPAQAIYTEMLTTGEFAAFTAAERATELRFKVFGVAVMTLIAVAARVLLFG